LAGQKRSKQVEARPRAGEPRQDERAQTRRKLEEVARKREGILHAAARAFARGGYHAATMQDIAREAGYTPPSLYAYFQGKEHIFGELAALVSRDFIAAFAEPVPAALAFPERLELLLRRLFEKADRHRDAVSVFLVARLSGEPSLDRGMTPDADQGAGFSSVQLLTDWLRQNAKRGELGEHRPDEMGIALAGLTHAFCIQWLASGTSTDIAPQVARVASLFLHGATGAAPAGAKPAAPAGAKAATPAGAKAATPAGATTARSRKR
jgi:AcrR family transcriptional regulator